MRVAAISAGLVAGASCRSAETVHCTADFVCPSGTVCAEALRTCVLPEQLAACDGLDDGLQCSYPGAPQGSCTEQVCFPWACGDGRHDPGEVCDDGNRTNGDGCSDDCRSNEQCGNEIVDAELGEDCDDGNNAPGDGCGPTCLVEACGNGYPDPGELCDDGNNISGDGCSAGCSSLESCGDGIVDGARGEQCDDGNRASRDGCSSGCTGELLTWTQHENPWKARAEAAAIYDQQQARLVLFGGTAFPLLTAETWELRDLRWYLRRPGLRPPARREHAMAYDPVRARTLLFGGATGWGGDIVFGDTWQYEGAQGAWLQRIPVLGPPPRARHSLTYDGNRDRTLLFGGLGAANVPMGDAWEFDDDNNTWLNITYQQPPPARHSHAAAFDPVHQRTIVFGGEGNNHQRLGDTWIYNGSAGTWSQVETASKPSPRYRHTMAFDHSRGVLVLFGGLAGPAEPLADTWEFDLGTVTWRQVVTPSSPPARYAASMAYDHGAERIVLIGGQQALSDEFADVWSYDGTTWTLHPPTWPESRMGAQLAFVGSRGRPVLFGGYHGDVPAEAATWEFDGNRWWRIANAAAGPPGRGGHGMAYHAATDELILFGGRTGFWTKDAFNDTWIFRNGEWTEATTEPAPPARSSSVLAYDPDLERTVMFGGELGFYRDVLSDTWVYSDGSWTELAVAEPPPRRALHLLTYDPALQQFIMAGGRDNSASGQYADAWLLDGEQWLAGPELPTDIAAATGTYAPQLGGVIRVAGGSLLEWLSDIWIYDETGWTPRAAAGPPPPARSYHAVTWDPIRRRLVMFGGWHGGDDLGMADTWTLGYQSDWPDELCSNTLDDDLDGVTDCADPDCEQLPGCRQAGAGQ